MGVGVGLARILLFIVTVVFFLVGIAFMAGGIWLLANQNQLFNILNLVINSEQAEQEIQNLASQKGLVQTAAIVMICVGVFTAVVSFFGCFGAIRESKLLLGVFAFCIVLILGAQIAAGVLTLYNRGRIEDAMSTGLFELQNRYLIPLSVAVDETDKQPHTSVTFLLNYLYVFAECCGARHPWDAANSTEWRKYNVTWGSTHEVQHFPAGCCPLNNRDQVLVNARWSDIPNLVTNQRCPITGVGSHNLTCVQGLTDFLGQYTMWIVVGCGALALAQLLVILFTVCLICAIE